MDRYLLKHQCREVNDSSTCVSSSFIFVVDATMYLCSRSRLQATKVALVYGGVHLESGTRWLVYSAEVGWGGDTRSRVWAVHEGGRGGGVILEMEDVDDSRGESRGSGWF